MLARNQPLHDVIFVEDWDLYHESPFGQGRKPKRILVCPQVAPRGYLIGGHRYLFKEAEGFRAQQVWSEVIAYRLGSLLNVPVPPAFLAYDRQRERPGVLVEFFYGHRHLPPQRLIHAIDLFQAGDMAVDIRRGSLKDNISLSRARKVTHWKEWWARTLAFDALIGNSDRHTENWGFLVTQELDAEPVYSLSPVYDNGTSLDYVIGNDALPIRLASEELMQQLATNGRHHFGWLAGDDQSAQHAALCRRFLDVFGSAGNIMESVIHFPEDAVNDVLYWCSKFDFPLAFLPERADLVGKMLRIRRDAVARSIRH